MKKLKLKKPLLLLLFITFLTSCAITPTIYQINYVLDEGINNTANPNTYSQDTLPITLQNPTKDGYIFEGWYMNNNMTEKIEQISNTFNGNITQKAQNG